MPYPLKHLPLSSTLSTQLCTTSWCSSRIEVLGTQKSTNHVAWVIIVRDLRLWKWFAAKSLQTNLDMNTGPCNFVLNGQATQLWKTKKIWWPYANSLLSHLYLIRSKKIFKRITRAISETFFAMARDRTHRKIPQVAIKVGLSWSYEKHYACIHQVMPELVFLACSDSCTF